MRLKAAKRLAYGAAKVFAYEGATQGLTAREIATRHGLNINSVYRAAHRVGVKFRLSPIYRKFPPYDAKTAP